MSIDIAIKKVAIRREVEPIVGYHASIICGLGVIVAATYVSRQLNVPSLSEHLLLWIEAVTDRLVDKAGGLFYGHAADLCRRWAVRHAEAILPDMPERVSAANGGTPDTDDVDGESEFACAMCPPT